MGAILRPNLRAELANGGCPCFKADRMEVCRPGVPVADRRGEELQEAARGVLADIGNDRRHDDGRRDRGGDFRRPDGRDDDQLPVRIRFVFGHGLRVT
jgi:hypothetical protein